MKKKIILILIDRLKFDGRVQKEIKTLKNNGYEVELIMAEFKDDNYNNYDFKIHNLKRKKKNKIYNLYTLISFNLKAGKLIKKLNPYAIHCNDIPTLLAGVIGKKNSILIYDAHELAPESTTGALKIIWSVMEKILIKFPDRFILPEINRLKYFKKKYKIKKPISLVENFPLKVENIKTNFFEKKYGINSNNLKAVYIGLISNERGIEEIIEAVSGLNLTLFCIGGGDKKYIQFLKEKLKTKNYKNVYILPPINQNEVLYAIRSSDMGFAFYKNINLNNYYCASNKLYEYLNFNIPVVTNNYPGLLKVLGETGIGEAVENLNSKEIRKKIIKIIKKTGIKSNKTYFWKDQEEEFLKTYKEIN